MISSRVVREPDGEPIGRFIACRLKNGKWRAYEMIDGWSQSSGAWSKRGNAIRDLDGNFLQFDTLEQTKLWAKGSKLK